MLNLEQIAKNAKDASIKLASLDESVKNKALEVIADEIEQHKEQVIEANKKDLAEATVMVQNGELSEAVFNRLKLDDNKVRDMIQGIRDMVLLEDPVNKILWKKQLADGLVLDKVTCPIGVIGVIFEARPDVIAQISALAVKSANAVLLKGGKEAQNTNIFLEKIINSALDKVEGFPKNTINLLFTREDVAKMLDLNDYIDLIIPRGSNALVKYIQSNTKIPVLGHADGICHIYIDESAELETILPVCVDSKCQYPSACNAVETILIDEKVSMSVFPALVSELEKNGVEVIADENLLKIVPGLKLATEEDWATEYGEKIVSVKSVKDVKEAVEHINKYGSGHTDSILTKNDANAEFFMNNVDSAGVFKNVSTRFSDGFRYGFGAEVGISTNKTHARGPVGLEGLTIYKYKLYGNGDIVADFSQGKREFSHKYL